MLAGSIVTQGTISEVQTHLVASAFLHDGQTFICPVICSSGTGLAQNGHHKGCSQLYESSLGYDQKYPQAEAEKDVQVQANQEYQNISIDEFAIKKNYIKWLRYYLYFCQKYNFNARIRQALHFFFIFLRFRIYNFTGSAALSRDCSMLIVCALDALHVR